MAISAGKAANSCCNRNYLAYNRADNIKVLPHVYGDKNNSLLTLQSLQQRQRILTHTPMKTFSALYSRTSSSSAKLRFRSTRPLNDNRARNVHV